VVKLLVLLLALLSVQTAEAQRVNLFGPKKNKSNTEILVVSESCGPCVEAKKIITRLQDEGYDVIIINIREPEARMFRIRQTPTLVVREIGEQPKKIVGLQTEDRYRELISQ